MIATLICFGIVGLAAASSLVAHYEHPAERLLKDL